MGGARRARPLLVLLRVGAAELERGGIRDARGDIPAEHVVRARLVRQDVEGLRHAELERSLEEVLRVPDPGDRECLLLGLRLHGHRERAVEPRLDHVEVARLEAAPRALLVDLGREERGAVHGRGEGLGAAHASQARAHDEPPREVAPEVLLPGGGERLVGPLQDPLGADVDPGARGHLPEHDEALGLELAELLPGRPVGDEVRVGDEDARGVRVRADDPDGLPRLHQQCLVGGELAERLHDRVVGGPAPRGLAGAAVDDEPRRVLGDLGVEVVHEEAHGRLGSPRLAGALLAARSAHRLGRRDCLAHGGVT